MTSIPGITPEQIAALRAAPTDTEMELAGRSVAMLADLAEVGEGENEKAIELREQVQGYYERLRATLDAGREVGRVLEDMTDAEALLVAADAAEQLIELVSGYRAKMVNAGFEESMAAAMAYQFHNAMLYQTK